MNTRLYVFSGTGNSLAAAETLAEILGDTTIESIPQAMKSAGPVCPEKQRIGFIFPVNYSGVPLLVSEFVSRISVPAESYVFAVCTSGGVGRYAVLQFDRLHTKGGNHLDAGWMVPMVDNYIPYGGAPDKFKQQDILKKADDSIREIASKIIAGNHEKPVFPLLSQILHTLLYQRFIRSLPEMDNRFLVDDTCNRCGICSKVCPADNIRIEQDRPIWNHHCLFCLACINFCPKEAIQLEEKLRGKNRYHNPSVPIKRLIEFQQGNSPDTKEDPVES